MDKEKKCGWCDGTGIACYANGGEDFDKDYCKCEAGVKLQQSCDKGCMFYLYGYHTNGCHLTTEQDEEAERKDESNLAIALGK